jgi:Fe-S-cluster-containing dehydrogenase component/CRP-like cAMP-binding protein
MPQEQTSRRAVIEAIQNSPGLSALLSQTEGHYVYELDLEVVVYGRNYNGKNVGPYVRLLTYEPGETIVSEGDWGGNTFHIVTKGQAEVLRGADKVAVLKTGTTFGHASLLAGVPRNATVKAPPSAQVEVLEIQRPALRLLRKLPEFSAALDDAYRKHSRDATLDLFKEKFNLTSEFIQALRPAAQFRVYTKNHVLCRAGSTITRLYVIREGWVRRTRATPQGEITDVLGHGYVFGSEALNENAVWPETLTLLGRTELLEISSVALRQNPALSLSFQKTFAAYVPPPLDKQPVTSLPIVQQKTLAAQEELIATGLIDGTNLLVMDMALCVRCGNCSLACHTIHGQSRLVRRGVHVNRLKKPSLRGAQSLLAPEVCMHCKDPECLTGCPTGAIGRGSGGQIDINVGSCIGCSDCATQCPYDAISMVPRKIAKGEVAKPSFGQRILNLFRIAPDPLPPAVETLDDLVAVKCNLCSDRAGMNPPGSKTKKYSCEENCPTGALARVNPHQYLTELREKEGTLFTAPNQVIGKNIHIADWPKRLLHLIGIVLTLATTYATWRGIQSFGLGQPLYGWLNIRWLTGFVGLFGIVGVMLYPWRRVIYTRRRGALRYWLLTHAYLGVIATIQLLLHGGTNAGGWLTMLLMLMFDLVILTGLFGIACYYVIPRLLTRIEDLPLLLDDLLTRRAELREEFANIKQAAAPDFAAVINGAIQSRFFSLSRLLRHYFKREPMSVVIEQARAEGLTLAKPARNAGLIAVTKAAGLQENIQLAKEALLSNRKMDLLLASLPDLAARQVLQVALTSIRDGLEAVEAAAVTAATLRRVEALIYLHRLLKLWLPPHVASSALMLALLVIHILQVLYFAAR